MNLCFFFYLSKTAILSGYDKKVDAEKGDAIGKCEKKTVASILIKLRQPSSLEPTPQPAQ
jgi:hypothetical protein